ncbi:inosine-uridine preferring nucleoside hydrolase [Microdochium bolleyi]|uniref:Inosine-uridine preferring nucleoside hydrolase n=1 Tax=Microdochium bolleyi TaxID=196109 RepID=A0A136J3P6_9PEZI|nr:inosine-uridine preferring nucleoside hydrolase [Microdochium bolleyi]
MAPKNRIIIDTDPGIDDILAILLGLAADAADLEILLLSVTYGNVTVEKTLKNAVALFHVLDLEMQWREKHGRPLGFESLRTYKPLVAIGPEHALEEEILKEDGFHGMDGLHDVHVKQPHLSPADTWKSLFKDGVPSPSEDASYYKYFTPSRLPAHKEILRILKQEPAGTVTICAVGPLTNVSMAAAEDPETFLRVKELVVMGGAVDVEGNITPVAEFNTYADAVASARVFALTSPQPASTMPPASDKALPAYPDKLSRQLDLKLFPLDITTPHLLNLHFFNDTIKPHLDAGSPLASWVNTFMSGTFKKITDIVGDAEEPGLSLHDPLTIWYAITSDDPRWKLAADAPEDIRVETSGQWTHGMHIRDRRGRPKPDGVTSWEHPGDEYGWSSLRRGNRINRIVDSPGVEDFAPYAMKRLFG